MIDSPAPVAELLQTAPGDAAARRPRDGRRPTCDRLPGGVANTTHGEGVRRGVGYAVAYKNVGFSEGFDDYSTARVRLEVVGGEPVASGAHRRRRGRPGTGHGRAADLPHRARRRAGRRSHPKDTQVGSGGSTSASRQTYVTGGAVQGGLRGGARRVLARLLAGRAARPTDARAGGDESCSPHGRGRRRPGRRARRRRRSRRPSSGGTGRPTRSTRRPVRASRTCSTRSPRTGPSSTSTSSSAWSRWSSSSRAQDVGKAHQPARGGRARSRADRAGHGPGADGGDPDGRRQDHEPVVHRLPDPHDPRHAADARSRCWSYADPHAPYGLRGVGEPPTISSGPAVVAAIRAGDRRVALTPGAGAAASTSPCAGRTAVTGIEWPAPTVERSAEILTPEALEFVADLQRRFGGAPRRAARRAAGAPRRDRPHRTAGLPAETADDPRRRLAGRRRPRRPDRPAGRDHRADRAQDDDQRAELRREGLAGRPRGRQHPALGATSSAGRSTCYDAVRRTIASPRPRARSTRCSDGAVPDDRGRARAAGTSTSGTCWSTAARGRGAGRLRAVLLPQRPRADRPRQRAVLLPAQDGVPPRGAAVERRVHHAQDALGIPHGTIRATVLIETIPAAFEMDEILYELRDARRRA